jgi:hypothetical protein
MTSHFLRFYGYVGVSRDDTRYDKCLQVRICRKNCKFTYFPQLSNGLDCIRVKAFKGN